MSAHHTIPLTSPTRPDFFGALIEQLDKVVLYSGNDDLLDSHRGTEIVIQVR